LPAPRIKNLYQELQVKEGQRKAWEKKPPERLEALRLVIVDDVLEKMGIPSNLLPNQHMQRVIFTRKIVDAIQSIKQVNLALTERREDQAKIFALLEEIDQEISEEEKKIVIESDRAILESQKELDKKPEETKKEQTEEKKVKKKIKPSLKFTPEERGVVIIKTQQSSQPKPQPKPQPEPDHYKTLGISRDATKSQIKKAYYKRALKNHPDKHRDEEAKYTEITQTLNAAYEILGDAEKREIYNQANPTAGAATQTQEAAPSLSFS